MRLYSGLRRNETSVLGLAEIHLSDIEDLDVTEASTLPKF